MFVEKHGTYTCFTPTSKSSSLARCLYIYIHLITKRRISKTYLTIHSSCTQKKTWGIVNIIPLYISSTDI